VVNWWKGRDSKILVHTEWQFLHTLHPKMYYKRCHSMTSSKSSIKLTMFCTASNVSCYNVKSFHQDWTKKWASRAAARVPTKQEVLRHHWNNWKYGAGKLRFPHMKKFLWKLATIWAHSQKDLPALS
jgi:hypothetical protein